MQNYRPKLISVKSLVKFWRKIEGRRKIKTGSRKTRSKDSNCVEKQEMRGEPRLGGNKKKKEKE